MKKTFLLLPLAAFVLTACSTSSQAPVVRVEGAPELSPGVMQPVAGTGAVEYGWQSDVQSTTMPTTMASVQPQVTYQPQPIAVQPAPQPVVQPTPQPVATPQPVQQATKKVEKAVQKVEKTTKAASQDFTIPRDEKNAPIYSQIEKGFYNGDTYTVRKGDTMFLIAYIAGKDVKELAKLNNMSEPYALNIGQKIKISEGANKSTQSTASVAPQPVQTATAPVEAKPVEPAVTYSQGPNGTVYGSDGTVSGPVKASVGTAPAPRATNGGVVASVGTVTATTPRVQATTASSAPAVIPSSIKWQWPTQGRVVSGFSAAEGGNKGLDIAGNKGQDVVAAAAGRVVYAGNALQGYGNLIIIKHNDDFLSAYAHNDKILVKEQENVKAGERIATMGSTGTNSTKLHFEIRYKGKSVDPARYLKR